MTKAQPEPRQYFRHTQSPAWGTAVLVRERYDQRTYLFTDGTARTFKTELAARFIEPADEPSPEDRVRLERGIASAAAQGATAALTRTGTATPKAVNLELEAQIRAARGEVGTFLVYADWLQTKNDPRGELIIAQHQLAFDPENKKLRAAEAQLLATHDAYFLPPRASQLLAARRKADAETTSTELTWRCGFIDRVHLARRSARQPELEPILTELLAHPSAQFLRALTLGALGDSNVFSYLELIGVIAKARPPLLDELFVGDFTHAQMELAFSRLGNVSPLLSALTELRQLVLRGGSLRFQSAIKHKRLERLSITAAGLAPPNLDRIAAATLPALHTLELSAPGFVITPELLDRIIAFPALKRLVLGGTIHTTRVLETLLRSPRLAELDELVLRDGDLADPAVIQLTQHAARWRHLRVLDLEGNRISPAAFARLDGLGNVLGAQRVEHIPLTIDAVLARAPDARSAQSARELADASAWRTLGRDGDRLWGQYEGSGSYWVYARLPSLECGCTCPSSRDPCKHALALLLLAAGQHPFADRPVPAAFRTRSERPRYRPAWE